MSKAVGIDLGSTFSVISHIKTDGTIEVIPNCEGNRITPSVFAINEDNNFLIGDLAVDYESQNPNRTIRLVKRKMSKGFDEIYSFNTFTISPCKVSAEIIKKLKTDAENYLGEDVTDAVITVPAYFNNDERQATKLAGELAGLNVLRIINEPTAASLAYGLEKKQNSTILVYDLGGGTFDVTILKLADGVDFHVLSTSGNTHLGGADFDRSLALIILNKFNSQYDYNYHQETLTDLDESQRTRLLSSAEKAKKTLSQVEKTTVSIPYFSFRNRQLVNLNVEVTRTDLESCLIDPLLKTKECIEQAMNDAKLSYSDLNEVVFVGGSTRIPFVSQKVEEWTGIKPNKSINPDEAVSIGAALQASVLSGTSDREIYLLDVCPLSLGIETQGGVMTTLILRNTQVPAVVKQMFTTAYDNQTSVDVKIYQGERPLTKDNLYLGEFELDNIQKAPRGLPKIEVFFEIDANGILSVKAVDEINGTEQQLTISGNNNLSSEEIQKILNDAQENKTSDENLRKLLNLQAQVKDYIIQTEELLRTNKFNEDESRDISELNSSLIKAENTSNFELLYSLIEDARETVSDMIKVLHKKAEESL